MRQGSVRGGRGDQLPRFCQGVGQFACIFAGPTGRLWAPSTLAVDKRRDLTNKIVRLNLRSQFLRNSGDKIDATV